MANIDKLARFIASLGSLNEYGSTIAQTKKALETENWLFVKSCGKIVSPIKQVTVELLVFLIG